MKKVLLGICSFFVLIGMNHAQVAPDKALSKATKALNAYYLDQNGNVDKLAEAVDLVEIATASPTTNESAKTWLAAGEIYTALADKDMIALQLDPTHQIQNVNSGVMAFNSYEKVLQLADKKYQTKEALKGMQKTANSLASIGNALLNAKDYTNAFASLNTILSINKVQQENGMKVTLANEKDLNDHKFVTAYCAMAADQKDVAKTMFNELIAVSYEEPRIYAYGFNLASEAGDANAMDILNKGREAHPDDSEILFAQINYYIQKEEYATLEGLLKEAITAAPDNPSVYSSLANVYMNLFQEEYGKSGNSDSANAYFNKSKDYYEQAVALDPTLFDVQYSLGSLYYNKAVELTKKMADLPISETKKFDEYKAESTKLFNTALPYFEKAEALNPNDINTLIALKEIFARNNDFEKSGEFKNRLKNVQSGDKNPESYFKQ